MVKGYNHAKDLSISESSMWRRIGESRTDKFCYSNVFFNLYQKVSLTFLNIFLLYVHYSSYSIIKNLQKYLCKKQRNFFIWRCGGAPDLWGRGPGFESGISHNDPDALQDLCDKVENLREERETIPPRQKRSSKKFICGQ